MAITYIYVILVNGVVSSDGWFTAEEHSEAVRVAKKYEMAYTVEVKRIPNYAIDLS